MKKQPNIRRDLPVRVASCVAMGGILTVGIICLFVGFGFNTVVGREAVYLSGLFLIINVLLTQCRERRLVRQKVFPPMSGGMHRFCAVVNCGWILGVLLLLSSGALLLCGVGLANFWSSFTVISGYVLALLGWAGNLMAYHRRRMAAMVVEQEKKSALQ